MRQTTAARIAELLPSRTAIIGGGGKTTLMLALAEELAAGQHSVLITTTTHLAWPPPKGCGLISPQSAAELNQGAVPGRVTLAGYPAEANRMVGLSPALLARADYDYILCEADGSRGLPLKVHRPGEPVIPPDTELVIQVAGLSSLGKPVEKTVHRYPLLGLAPEEVVTPGLIARILQQGRSRWSGPVIHLLNQADTPELRSQGLRIRQQMMEITVVCSLKNEQAPIEVP